MDGNHSLLGAVPGLIQCADVQSPLIFNIAVSLPVSVCVVWLILAGPRDKATEIFTLNHDVCEVVICVGHVISLITINSQVSSIAILTILFYSTSFLYGFLYSGCPVFISCICLDRYVAVVHPVMFLKYKPLRYRLAGTIFLWLTVLVCSVILVWIPYPAMHYVTFGMAFSGFLVMFFCCIETLRALLRPGPGEGNQGGNGMNRAKLKAFKIILIMVVGTTISYLPYIFAIILLGHTSQEYTSILLCISAYVSVVDGLLPPLFYIYKAGKLRHCIKNTV